MNQQICVVTAHHHDFTSIIRLSGKHRTALVAPMADGDYPDAIPAIRVSANTLERDVRLLAKSSRY